MTRNCVRIGFVAAICLIAAWIVVAETPPNGGPAAPTGEQSVQTAPIASRSLEDSPPTPHSTSWVDFQHDGKEVRVVGISPQLRSSPNYVKGLRFHKILGALVERDTPIEPGLPCVIDGIRREPSGLTWLRFRVLTSSPELKQRARDAVVSQERDLLKAEGLTQDDVRVEPWPLKHCVIALQDTFTHEILGVTQTGALSGKRDEFAFAMRFTPDALTHVVELIEKGELEFVYTYSYTGKQEVVGRVQLDGVRNAKMLASQKLRSAQVAGEEPIFQSDANEACHQLMVSAEVVWRVGGQDVLPLLKEPLLMNKLFDEKPLTLADLQGDARQSEIVNRYLTPQLEQVRESLGDEKNVMTIHQDAQGSSETGSVGGGVSLVFFSLGGGVSQTKTKEILDRVEASTGSKWSFDKASESFRPHSIKTFKWKDGADQLVLDQSLAVFLSVSAEERYLEDSAIPVTFTSKVVGYKGGGEADLGPYEGVPIGAILPFVGVSPPKGYAWLSPESTFPNADWVPVHLRGTPVFDASDEIFGVATTPDEIGKINPGGSLTFKVEGRYFALPKATEEGRTYDDIIQWRRGPSPLGAVMTPGGPDALVKPVPITDSWREYNGTVVGDQQITIGLDEKNSVPRRLMIGWIIRLE